LLSFYPIMSIR